TLLQPPIATLFPYTTLFRSRRCRDRPAPDSSYQRAGAQPVQNAFGALRSPRDADRPAVVDERVRKPGPILARHDLHQLQLDLHGDRKSTCLNSSHEWISYAV